MKSERSASKAGLFLIELIIAIAFFAVASAICVQLFVKAYLISARSSDISVASGIAQNEAEAFKADSGAYIDSLNRSGERLLYDARGNRLEAASGEEAAYYLICDVEEEDGLHAAVIAVYKAEEPVAGGAAQAICRLDIKAYTGA